MKRNRIIIFAFVALAGLWVYSQSGNASTVNSDCGYHKQMLVDTTIVIDN